MPKLSKNAIASIVVIIIIVIGGIFYLAFQQKEEPLAPAEKEEQGGEEEIAEEALSLAGEITSVAPEESFIMVKPVNQENEVKVVLSENTEIIQLKFPFEPGGAPTEGTFTPERISITIADLEAGRSVLIEANTNIAGKTEINNIRQVQVLP